MAESYIFFYLEVALKNPKDSNIYAFENISHIPTKKLIEIFKIDLDKDPNILEGYFLTKANYKLHKSYIEKEIGAINLNIFEYCLRQYYGNNKESINRLYKRALFE